MVLKGSPIENATTMEEIKDSIFGAQIGTTSLSFINTVIQPTNDPRVFDSTSDAKAALRNGTVDGLVLDLPDRVLRGDDQHAERRAGGPVPERGRALGIFFEEGSPLVECVNLALAEMTADGTLGGPPGASGWRTTWPSPSSSRRQPGLSVTEPPEALPGHDRRSRLLGNRGFLISTASTIVFFAVVTVIRRGGARIR